jgi:hypothetical protein
MDNYVVTPANNSTEFNIPVFRSLPSLINYNNDDSDTIINQKITKIDIQNIQDEEPFKNYSSTLQYKFLLFLLIILIFLFLLFTRKK